MHCLNMDKLGEAIEPHSALSRERTSVFSTEYRRSYSSVERTMHAKGLREKALPYPHIVFHESTEGTVHTS